MTTDPVVPDIRVSLTTLSEHWSGCTQCDLGIARVSRRGAFVFGEGDCGGVMFIGEGPGRDEEVQGRPFIGASGQFLRELLKVLSFTKVYITNTVCCRSWGYEYDGQGNRKTRLNRRTGKEELIVRDEAPKPVEVKTCSARLLYQIYLVDPLLIVTLGGAAAEGVLGRAVKVQAESGTLQHVDIPGAMHVPSLTPKGSWVRKVRGEMVYPTKQNTVKYPVVTLVHPAFAMANKNDKRIGSPMHLFTSGLESARNIYAAYAREVYGEANSTYELPEGTVEALTEDDDVAYPY